MGKSFWLFAFSIAVSIAAGATEGESVPANVGDSPPSAHGAKASGIGAVFDLTPNQTIIVKAVPSGTPAYLAGLRPNDLITSVQIDLQSAPVEVAGKRLEEITSLIRGPKGTPVILGVLRPNGETLSLKIQRQGMAIRK